MYHPDVKRILKNSNTISEYYSLDLQTSIIYFL